MKKDNLNQSSLSKALGEALKSYYREELSNRIKKGIAEAKVRKNETKNS